MVINNKDTMFTSLTTLTKLADGFGLQSNPISSTNEFFNKIRLARLIHPGNLGPPFSLLFKHKEIKRF
jgi:hypothetical protein